jgi:hypothetical protein
VSYGKSHNERLWFSLLCVIVLAFCGAVYVAYLAWRKMGPRRRIAGVLLLVPRFLLVACLLVSLACGHPPQGSPAFNTQSLSDVLVVLILPLPTLVGTLVALGMFMSTRFGW